MPFLPLSINPSLTTLDRAWALHRQLFLVGLALLVASNAPASAQTSPNSAEPHTSWNVFDMAREKRQSFANALGRERDPARRLALRLAIGDLRLHPGELDALDLEDRDNRASRLDLAFATRDLDEVERAVRALRQAPELSPREREQIYRWYFLIEDLSTVEELCGSLEDPIPDDWEDLFARATLAFQTIRVSLARSLFVEARERPGSDNRENRARTHRALARCDYNDRDFEGAKSNLTGALRMVPLDAETWYQYGLALIRLGETDDAIAACELAIALSPSHEAAHYMLGNGYARENYTELFERAPNRFSEGSIALAETDSLLRGGHVDSAEAAYRRLDRATPNQTDIQARLGSIAFSRSDWPTARFHFEAALRIVPEYGRAHNGLAKALEADRHARHPQRIEDERAFAALAMPQVEGIEDYVVNWKALSPRHQKRVALSIAPWGKFLPALLAGGATHYIKPLHERLSETPGQTTLADARISYDSRLWDDVRGCGGHHTVTGIEDVERSVFGRYNTVLHELTHQVHGVLPGQRDRQIEALYRQTKERDDARGSAFLSRYAGGSVWEYFAEGANAAMTPNRGPLDTREITLERLEAIDPSLHRLVLELMHHADVDSSFVTALVGRGDQALRRGDTEAALTSFRAALERDSTEPSALRGETEALLYAGKPNEAMRRALAASTAFPEDGELATAAAQAQWFAGSPLTEVMADLKARRLSVRRADRPSVDLALGSYAWSAGDAGLALQSYERALSVQSDDPSALWGRASAHALASKWEDAWRDYDHAVTLRTGIIGLRCDYARDLIRSGDAERARQQLDAALLLDRTSTRARALLAWWHLENGNATEAESLAQEVLQEEATLDFARLVAARAQRISNPAADPTSWLEQMMSRSASPYHVFEPKRGTYRVVAPLPQLDRQLLQAWFPGRAPGTAPSKR